MSEFATCPRCRGTYRLHAMTVRNQKYCPSCEAALERAADANAGRGAIHAGPCIEALAGDVDTDNPALVTCLDCLERLRNKKPLTFAQQRRAAKGAHE